MATHETIKGQEDLLTANRRTLGVLLRQKTAMGVYVTTGVEHDIAARRRDIAKIKAYLRQNNVRVDNQPNDEDEDVFTPTAGVPTTPLPVIYQVVFYNQSFFGTLIRDDPFDGVRAIEVLDRSTGLRMTIEGPYGLFTRVS